jgi:hypothetical protein
MFGSSVRDRGEDGVAFEDERFAEVIWPAAAAASASFGRPG